MGVSTSDIAFQIQDLGKRHGARTLVEAACLASLILPAH
jgi:hypothetical protein